jgi:hypothetical protein
MSGMMVAQDSTQVKLKVFVEGNIPDFNYLRNNIRFVDFVNDRFSSDVHIIVTNKGTGGGGEHYYISFTPVTIHFVDKLMLNCITSYQDSQDDVRYKFTETIKTGLLVFANEKQLYYQVKVGDDISVDNGRFLNSTTPDKWDNWVFNIGLDGGFDSEEQETEYSYTVALEANRITDMLRIRNDYEYEREDKFITKYEGTTERKIHVFNREQEFRSRITYSLSSHWSAGIILEGNQTSYRNIESNAMANPAIEYNFYPWQQVDRHLFTIAYYVGPSYYNYYEPTIFNKTDELLWAESLLVELEKVEEWGELELSLEASHYLPDFTYFSLQFGAELSVKIAKGLSLELGFEAERVNNQLYLPASELSDEELLLNVRKLPTAFEISGDIGIRFQFGSIYNNIVNQRL